MRDTAAQQTGTSGAAAGGPVTDGDQQPVWFLPVGRASGERNRRRARGWILVLGAALVVWAGIIVGVWALIGLLR